MAAGGSRRTALQLAALAVAGALAIWGSVPLAVTERPSQDGIGLLDGALAPLRPALGPQARVAVLLATDDIAPWYATQYALAPATVVRVMARECMGNAAGSSCGADATHLLVFTNSVEYAAMVGARLGFVPAFGSSGVVLLARGAP